MTELNIPAIAGAAFLGFLALAALLFLFAPVTRFLGDLFCCPWRIPFTRKRRRNGDEEVDKEDLPYLSERRLESPVNGTANKSMSAEYVMGTRDHEAAREAYGDDTRHTEDGQETDVGYYGGAYGGAYEASYWGSYNDAQGPFPRSHGGDWRSRTDEYSEYTEPATHVYHAAYYYSDEDHYGYDKETFPGPEIQRPQPSYSPSETMSDQYTADYFPRVRNEYYSQYRRQ